MRVLVACEFSGVVREAFARRGHDAWSCDLIPTEQASAKHMVGDVRDHLDEGWDIMIAHPPCQYLASSGARWWKRPGTRNKQLDAYAFAVQLFMAKIPRIAMENPIGILSTMFRKPDQIVQPWLFGHGEVKATCLWLKNLSKLQPTSVVDGRRARVHFQGETKWRWKARSRTLKGLADAMASQWSHG